MRRLVAQLEPCWGDPGGRVVLRDRRAASERPKLAGLEAGKRVRQGPGGVEGAAHRRARLAPDQGRGALEGLLFGSAETGFAGRKLGWKTGDEIGNPDAALAVDPDPGAKAVGIARVAGPTMALAVGIVRASG